MISPFEDGDGFRVCSGHQAARETRDLGILNREAAGLNREMEDVLAYQADL